MMTFYFVKQDLYGIKRGRVERFAPHKAGPLLVDGSIEAYDPKNKKHSTAPGAPTQPEPEAK
jgi:hypothetical protein